MLKDNKSYIYIYMPIIAFVLYYIVVLCCGLNNYVIIHDNLECELPLRIFLNYPDNSLLYSDGIIHTLQNGVPRNYLPTDLNITSILFSLFSPWIAYFINDAIARVIGFIGFSLLLNQVLKDSEYKKWIILACALTFSLLGSYNICNGLTFMGLPFLTYIFYNVFNRHIKWYYYLLVILFAFSTQLTLIGVFVLVAVGLWWIIDAIEKRSINYKAAVIIAILTVAYVIAEYRMVATILNSDFISHREEFTTMGKFNLIDIIYSALSRVILTQYHGGTLCSIPIVLIVLYNFILKKKISNKIKWLLSIIIIISIVDVIYLSSGCYLGIFNSFQLNRFYFFYPIIWLLILGFSCEDILVETHKRRFNVCLCAGMMSLVLLSSAYKNQELVWNSRTVLLGYKLAVPSYREFFDHDLFKNINTYIGGNKTDYKVISCGLHPSIASVNGFFTLDSYIQMYPLEYKHKFREIISGELDKDPDLKSYFDDWGNRCYMFVADRDCAFANINDISIEQLDINTSVLADMGCEYIFSKYKIDNASDINLSLEKAFDGLYWRIYLYKINN